VLDPFGASLGISELDSLAEGDGMGTVTGAVGWAGACGRVCTLISLITDPVLLFVDI